MNISISPWVLPFLMGLITLLFFLSIFVSGRAKYMLLSMMCFVTSLGGGYITIYPRLAKERYVNSENTKTELLSNESWESVYKHNNTYYMNDQEVNIVFDLNNNESPYVNISNYSGSVLNIEILTIQIKDIHLPKSYDKLLSTIKSSEIN